MGNWIDELLNPLGKKNSSGDKSGWKQKKLIDACIIHEINA